MRDLRAILTFYLGIPTLGILFIWSMETIGLAWW